MKFLIISIITFWYQLVLSAPIENELYHEIITICPKLTNDTNFKSNDLFHVCKQYKSTQQINRLDETTKRDLLCLMYYNSFLSYCVEATQTIQTNNIPRNIYTEYHVGNVCESNNAIVGLQNKSPTLGTLKKVIKSSEDCTKLCSDEFDELEKVCGYSYYFINLTRSIKQAATQQIKEQSAEVSTTVQKNKSSPAQIAITPDAVTPKVAPSANTTTHNNNITNVSADNHQQPTEVKIDNNNNLVPIPNIIEKTSTVPQNLSISSTNSAIKKPIYPLENNEQFPSPHNKEETQNSAHKVQPDSPEQRHYPDNKVENKVEGSQTNVDTKPNPSEIQLKPGAVAPEGEKQSVDAETGTKKKISNTSTITKDKVTVSTNGPNAESDPKNFIELPDVDIPLQENNDLDQNDMVRNDPDAANDHENYPGEGGDDDDDLVESKDIPKSDTSDSHYQPVGDYTAEMEGDSPFFSYFMLLCIVFIVAYVCYHNKQKILALLLEGRRGKRQYRNRRPNSANYHKLDSNLEEAITSSCSKNVSNVIY